MQRVNEGDCEYRDGDSGVKYLMRGPKIDWGVILLKPGQEMGEHGHEQVEETFYFLQGQAKMIVNGTPRPATRSGWSRRSGTTFSMTATGT